ncbi:hypothetical protein [Micromonospora sp. LOL_021]|uniref:hypothetical protein n=1 Tax=Micromonospora sp. LOL_021 TaxID=3345417 RepID=UPI003A837F99
MLVKVRAYDSADSPGPIPSVIDHFRPGPDLPEQLSEAEHTAARYTVILLPPEEAEILDLGRDNPGLKLYLDHHWEADVTDLVQAATLISEHCDKPVTLVEHRADLCYWTAYVKLPYADGRS